MFNNFSKDILSLNKKNKFRYILLQVSSGRKKHLIMLWDKYDILSTTLYCFYNFLLL